MLSGVQAFWVVVPIVAVASVVALSMIHPTREGIVLKIGAMIRLSDGETTELSVCVQQTTLMLNALASINNRHHCLLLQKHAIENSNSTMTSEDAHRVVDALQRQIRQAQPESCMTRETLKLRCRELFNFLTDLRSKRSETRWNTFVVEAQRLLRKALRERFFSDDLELGSIGGRRHESDPNDDTIPNIGNP